MGIKDHKVVEREFIKDRWHVKFDKPYKGKSRMPQANYVWLKGNPSFEDLPKGYVVHHLDHDKLNDDISNLVIMQKHHHTSHHWKNKTIEPEIVIRGDFSTKGRNRYFPETKPRVYKRNDRGTYYVTFKETIDGESKYIKVGKYKGRTMKKRWQAEKFAEELTSEINRLDNGPSLVAQITT